MNTQIQVVQDNSPDAQMPAHDERTEDEKIREGFEKIASLKLERKSINEEVSAVVSDLGSVGIPPAAVKLIAALSKLTKEEREEIEAAVIRCRKALGWDAQQSLL